MGPWYDLRRGYYWTDVLSFCIKKTVKVMYRTPDARLPYLFKLTRRNPWKLRHFKTSGRSKKFCNRRAESSFICFLAGQWPFEVRPASPISQYGKMVPVLSTPEALLKMETNENERGSGRWQTLWILVSDRVIGVFFIFLFGHHLGKNIFPFSLDTTN